MKKIYKYTLEEARTNLTLPSGYQILSTEEQRGAIVLYAMVDPDVEEEEAVFVSVMATGQDIEHEATLGQFLGTVKLANGNLMYHVFWRPSLSC